MKILWRLVLLVFGLVPFARAESLSLSVLPSAHRSETASDTAVELVVFNRGTDEQRFSTPPALPAELVVGAQSWLVELRTADATPQSVAPGTFISRTYTFSLPPDISSGRAILTVHFEGLPSAYGVLDLTPAAAPAASTATTAMSATAPAARRPTTNLARAVTAASALQRTFANRLAPHEPIYFIYGPDAPAAKFQFSFKYKLLNFTDLSESDMARTLQFAFTQRSLWDIEGDSSPFYDTSYMPEVIYESLTPKPEDSDRWFTWLGYQAAFRHESNGRDGPVSRSLNVVYLRPVFAFGNLERWHLLVIPELQAYVDSLEDNDDLDDYRGYGQLRVVLGRNNGPSLMVSTWGGKDFDHSTVQLDLTVPLRTKLLNFETYLLVQYFNGYGESLLSYREQSEAIRAGVSFVR